jgi:threonine/homoserine/homoserine lactone efflux protein
MSQGRSSGFASLAGIQVGTYCHALVAALGLSQLLITVPAAFDAVRLVGAAYLMFLSWKAFYANPVSPEDSRILGTKPLLRVFGQGLATNLLNPKVALFVLALFPQFVDPEKGSVVVQMLIFATILNIVGSAVNSLVIMLASRVGNRLARDGNIAKRLNQLLGVVFFGLACRLALISGR